MLKLRPQGSGRGKTLHEQAVARGYQIVTDAASLAAISEANQGKPLLGLFSDGNMPVRWEGPKASYHGNIDKPPVTCTPNPKRDASVPTLAQMTEKKRLISLAATRKVSSCRLRGRLSINRTTRQNPCGQIGETVDLDEAVQKALEFAKKRGQYHGDRHRRSRPLQPDYPGRHESAGPDPSADDQKMAR